MGLQHKSGPVSEGYQPVEGNPNPANFTILSLETIQNHTICIAQYPDAWTFEGIKILLYRNTTAEEVRNLKLLDPHFSQTLPSPFARFEPTPDGLMAARFVARSLPPGILPRHTIKICRKCGKAGLVASAAAPLCANCVGESR